MAKKPKKTSHKSRFELLEDRRLLTAYNVTDPFTGQGTSNTHTVDVYTNAGNNPYTGAGPHSLSLSYNGEDGFGDDATVMLTSSSEPSGYLNNNDGSGTVSAQLPYAYPSASTTPVWDFGIYDSGPNEINGSNAYPTQGWTNAQQLQPGSFDTMGQGNSLGNSTLYPGGSDVYPDYPGGAADGVSVLPGTVGFVEQNQYAGYPSFMGYIEGTSGLNGDGSGNPVPDVGAVSGFVGAGDGSTIVDIPTGTIETISANGPNAARFTAPTTGSYTITASFTDPYFNPFDGPGGGNGDEQWTWDDGQPEWLVIQNTFNSALASSPSTNAVALRNDPTATQAALDNGNGDQIYQSVVLGSAENQDIATGGGQATTLKNYATSTTAHGALVFAPGDTITGSTSSGPLQITNGTGVQNNFIDDSTVNGGTANGAGQVTSFAHGNGGTWSLKNMGAIAASSGASGIANKGSHDLTHDEYDMTWTLTKTVALKAGDSINLTGDSSPDHYDTSGNNTAPSYLGATIATSSTTAAPLLNSGATSQYTLGGSAVAINGGQTVSSGETDLTGSTLSISGNFQSGDALNFPGTSLTYEPGSSNTIAVPAGQTMTETTSSDGNMIVADYYSTSATVDGLTVPAGTLTLTGSATPAEYQSAIQSITFSTSSLNTNARTITVNTGEVSSNTVHDIVDISTATNTPPSVTTSGSTGQTFTIGGMAKAVDSGLQVNSTDANITGATVQITNYQTGDSLNYTPIDSVTVSANASGLLTLTGTEPAASYQAALRTVTFSTTSSDTAERIIDVTGIDTTASPTTGNTGVDYVFVNNSSVSPPAVTASGSTGQTFTLGGAAKAVDSGLQVSSSASVTGATVTISNYQSGDSLNYTAIDGVTIVTNTAGVLTLTGTQPAASYQAALDSVTFSTTSTTKGTRSIGVVADDSAASPTYSNTAADTVIVAIAPPVVTPSGSTSTFTLGGSAVTIDSGVAVTSADTDITGATLTITNWQSGDLLNYSAIDGVTVFTNANGVLQLTGNQPASSYAAALQTVTFSSTSTDNANRTLTLVANDSNDTGNAPSTTANETVDFKISAPVVTPSGTTNTYTLGQAGSVYVDNTIAVTSADTNITGATVTITNYHSGDTLGFSTIDGISAASNSGGVLTLTGTEPASYYAAALQSVTFSTSSSNNANRTLTVVANDSNDTGNAPSNTANETVDIDIPAPVVTPSGTTQTYTLGGLAKTIDSGISVTSHDATITGATLTINNDMTGDTLGFSTIDGVSASSNTGGVLTLTGNQPAASYAAALASVTFSTTATSGTARSISVVAYDSNDTGNVASNSGAETVNINIPAPVVTANQAAKAATVGQTVTVDSAVTVTSFDANVTGATVTITNAVGGDTLHYTAIDGVTVVSNTGGVLTLTGNQPASSYAAALQTVTFSNTSSTSTTTRNVTIAVQDSGDTGNVAGSASTTITLTPPITITAAYLSGTAWTSAASHPGGATEEFEQYLSTHSLGSATLGYNLQDYGTFSGTQTTPLPWGNINQITVTFSGTVSASSIGLGSLKLVGGTGSTSVAAPSVSSFTSDGSNTYTWTLAGPLGNNKFVFAIATTGSSFGTPGSTQVVDGNGAGISGTFTTGNSLPSGNGYAGSTFDYFFNVMPGDVNHTTTATSAADITLAKQGNNQHETSATYNPYIDFLGAGVTSAADVTFAEGHNSLHNNTLTGPTAPSASQVGTTGSSGFTALALGVLDTGTSSSSTTTSTVVSNVIPASSSSTSTAPASTSGTSGTGSSGGSSTTTSSSHGRHQFAANDEAVGDFDLADLYV